MRMRDQSDLDKTVPSQEKGGQLDLTSCTLMLSCLNQTCLIMINYPTLKDHDKLAIFCDCMMGTLERTPETLFEEAKLRYSACIS